MRKKDLLEFLQACATDASLEADFIAVCVQMSELVVPEIIINPAANIEYKYDYYNNNYTDDLYLMSNKDIKIVGWGAGHTPEEAFEAACLIDD